MKKLLILAAVFLAFENIPAQDVTFKVETKLVIVNVAVRDKSGNPITTLKKQDFEVLEDGVRQNIGVFELERLSNDLLAPVQTQTAPRTLEVRAQPAPATTPAAVAASRHPDRRLLALFFDMSSMPQFDQIRAQENAIKFVQTQMTSSDLVSIMTFGNKLNVVEDFTGDRDLLLDDLKKLTLGEAAELADAAATGADEGDDSGAFTADDTEFNIFNTDRKLSALEDAARKLSVYPEKKALIYFSSGVSKTGIENQSQIKATVNAAVRANVSIYSVDARGLVATAPAGDASKASPRGTGVLTGSAQQGQRNSFNDSQETIATLAADTGGKALLDDNDLTMGIRQAQKDISSYYILGYYSTNAAPDGKFRRIRVRLTDPQLQQAKLDYRDGYYASKVFQKFTAADKERQLEEALTLGDPVSELPLVLEVDYFRVARDRYFVPVSVKIPGSVLALAKRGGRETTDLDFIGQVRDEKGKLIGGVRDQINVKLNSSDAAQLEKRNLEYDAGLTLAPGQYSLRFLARENQTGKMGTFETKFTIPDLNAAKSLKLSSVIWSSQKEAVTAAVGSAENNKKLIANHPLVQNGQKTVPSITRVFRKDQTLYVYFEVYDPAMDPDRKVPSLAAEVDLFQGARKAYTSPPVRAAKLGTSRPGVVPFSFQIPLSRLPAGQYVSQVSVIDETGRKFAFPRSEMVLLPEAAKQ